MYYHYTNRSGAMAISSSGYIQPSEQIGSFGPGVYLTDLHPLAFFRDEILANNYGGIKSEFHNRADWVVEVTLENINMQLLSKVHVPGNADRRIFVYPNFILVRPNQIYDKPRCLKSYVADDDTTNDTEGSDFESEDESNDRGEGQVDDNEYESGEQESRIDECGTDENGDTNDYEDGAGCCESEDGSHGCEDCFTGSEDGSSGSEDGSYGSGVDENEDESVEKESGSDEYETGEIFDVSIVSYDDDNDSSDGYYEDDDSYSEIGDDCYES